MTITQLLGLACLLLVVWSFIQCYVLVSRGATAKEMHHAAGPTVAAWMFASVLLAVVALVA